METKDPLDVKSATQSKKSISTHLGTVYASNGRGSAPVVDAETGEPVLVIETTGASYGLLYYLRSVILNACLLLQRPS